MNYITHLIGILIAGLFSSNIVLNRSIGICPFLGVSKKTDAAVGMGIAVTFVLAISSLLVYTVYNFILVPLSIEYLSLVIYILLIASVVQLLEVIIKRFSPNLYSAMGIYLPLITTNCCILFVANYVGSTAFDAGAVFAGAGYISAFIEAISVGLGFLLALVIMSGVRERQARRIDIPKSLQGFPLALIAAGIISLAFAGLAGLNFFA